MSSTKRLFGLLDNSNLEGPSNKCAKSPAGRIPTGNSSTVNPSAQSTQATSASQSESSRRDQAKATGRAALSKIRKYLDGLQQSCGVFEPLVTATRKLQEVVKVIEADFSDGDSLRDTANDLAQWAVLLTSFVDENQPVRMSTQMENLTNVLLQGTDYLKRQTKRETTRLDELEEDMRRLECFNQQVEGVLLKLSTEASLNMWKNTDNQLKESLLNAMLPAHDAVYDSSYADKIERGPCLQNTRVAVLNGIRNWMHDPGETKVYWINGMAGTGKTTIAYSVCEELARNKRLGASFFVSRASSQCQDVSRILPTIAYQLARISHAYRSALCRILNEEPNAGQRKLSVQFEHLIELPLRKAADKLSKGLVVVIDALDECSVPRSAEMIADMLLQHASSLPVRFFLTSRPVPSIMDMVLSDDCIPRSVLHLHNVEEYLVQSDIKTYLTVSLARLKPAGDQIEWLADQAGVLFIYAATLVRYVLATGFGIGSKTRLDAVLTPGTMRASKKDRAIDKLYKAILEGVLQDEEREDDELQVIKQVLWTVVSSREPVTKTALSGLLEVDENQVTAALEPLQSVIHVFGRSEVISTLHASFPEFVLTQSRSGLLSCDKGAYNQYLTTRCFAIMNDQLRFNICGLTSSYEMDKDVPKIEARVQEAISPALFYASRYWADHLALATVCEASFTSVDMFLKHRLLFWMEVLNLKGCIERGKDVLMEANKWLQANQRNNALLNDCLSFLTSFAQSPVQSSTPHIYISHLPLGSKDNQVRQIYLERTRGLVQAGGTAVGAWLLGSSDHFVNVEPAPSDNSLTVIAHTGHIDSVTFSLSGSKIATSSEDGTISIWDSCIGSRITRFSTGEKALTAEVIFSPDESRLVYLSSGLSPKMMVWDVKTGVCLLGPIGWNATPMTTILNACFSPDNTRIAVTTACEYNFQQDPIALTVLDIYTGEALCELALPYESTLVAFSSDGNHILSSLPEGEIEMWDSYTGTPHESHSLDALRSDIRQLSSNRSRQRERPEVSLFPFPWVMNDIAAFSPKDMIECRYYQSELSGGPILASKLVLGDSSTKKPLTGPFGREGEHISTFSFSPDGTRIFSGSEREVHRGIVREDSLYYIRAWNVPKDHENHRMKALWEIDENGWVRNQDAKPVIWVPAEWQRLFPLPPNTLAIGPEGSLKVSMDNLLLGESWTRCFDPSAPTAPL